MINVKPRIMFDEVITYTFWIALLKIIGIDLILSGDNAVVIALACRNLPKQQQKMGVFLGASAAVILRIIFTIFVFSLIGIPYLKLIGGVLLFWIAYKLLKDDEESVEHIPAPNRLWHAIWTIIVADAVMSLDNVIAVAAAAKGDLLLLILGLIISIPLVVYGAKLLLKLIDRFPIIVPAGAALIGYVGAEVMITDPAIDPWVNANASWLHYVFPLFGLVVPFLISSVVKRSK